MFADSQNLSHYNRRNMIVWFLMAVQAGAINAGGFLACNRFVSHVTGFATHTGAELSQGHLGAALGMLLVPVFFLLGSMLSAYFIDRRISQNQMPEYALMFGIIAGSMFAITTLGLEGFFGEFGSNLKYNSDYILLALLCLCCGIQNSTITSASGAVVRTTHLTGITTDLGIGLMRVFEKRVPERIRSVEFRANWLRSGIIFFFILGSTLAAILFSKMEYAGFVLPGLISLNLMIYAIIRRRGSAL